VAVLAVIGLLGGVAWWIVRAVLASQGVRYEPSRNFRSLEDFGSLHPLISSPMESL
jgi:hypothetical protein